MNYEEFTENVKQGVEDFVEERLADGIVVIRNVLKNNGVRMKAVSIVQKNERATPTIYLKSFYEEYQCGRTLRSICQEIFETYLESLEKFKQNIDVDQFLDFEKIKDKIHYRLVNYEWNEGMLKNIPHFKFLDLAIIFFVIISTDEEGMASVLVYNHNLESWNKTAEEIREIATTNTLQNCPAQIKNMEDIVAEMILNDLPSEWNQGDSDYVSEDVTYGNFDIEDVRQIICEEVRQLKAERDMEMYVLTNHQRLNGAACITYPGVLKNFADNHQSDVYLIPSSVHEVILIPGNHWDQDWLNGMVQRVNQHDLNAVDVLSDHVYLYERETDRIVY